jgi:hypothetical protein
MITNPNIIKALVGVAREHRGLLRADDVVRAAANIKSPLHNSFEWNKDKAAHNWLLHQARNLIRVTMWDVEREGEKQNVRVFVSLSTDRDEAGGGYRAMINVLHDKGTRRQLIEDALNEMARLEFKYDQLRELSDIFKTVNKVRASIEQQWNLKQSA